VTADGPAPGAVQRQRVHPDDIDTFDALADRLAGTAGDAPAASAQVRLRHTDGTYRWLDVVGADLRDHPSVRGVVYNARDITEARALQDKLLHQATHDALTGLANRVLFRDRAEQAMRVAVRTREPVGLVALDLNGFKQVNDTLGHHSGDLLLKHVAGRLTECVRDTDTIARLGGDEFAIVLPNVTSVADATEVARRVLEAIRQPLHLDGQPAEVGASIGVAVFPEHGDDVELLLQRADSAMYAAKRGKLGVCVAGEPPVPITAGHLRSPAEVPNG